MTTPFSEPEPLSPEAEEALRDSIAEFGVLVPVCVATDGTTVEGRHRERIALGLGVDYPHWTVRVEADRREDLTRRLNSDRRAGHLPQEERDQVVGYLLRLGHSHRAIARAMRIGKATVKKVLAAARPDAPAVLRAAPSPSPTSARPASAESSRFVSSLAELVSTCSALAETDDLTTVISPQDAQQWTGPLGRASGALRTLQTRMREHAQR